MTSEQEVRQIIAKDVEAFNNKPFPEELPEWLLENFDDIIMEMPQRDAPYFARTIRTIRMKKIDDITTYEGGFLLNLYTNTVPRIVCKDINTFLERKEIVEKIMYRYNDLLQRHEKALELKQKALMKAIPNVKIITS